MYNATAKNPGGYLLIASSEDNFKVEADTMTCCHCNTIWHVQPGSGTKRGFCTGCRKMTCGHPKCHVCIPFEQRMDLYEQGKIIDLLGDVPPDLKKRLIF